MINPRTVPYTPQRLAAIKHEFTRPLPKVTHTSFPFAAISSGLQNETPNVNLEPGFATLAENGLLVTKTIHASDLCSGIGNKSANIDGTGKLLYNYLPYIIGGAIITLALYLYLESRRAKEKEESTHTRLVNLKNQD